MAIVCTLPATEAATQAFLALSDSCARGAALHLSAHLDAATMARLGTTGTAVRAVPALLVQAVLGALGEAAPTPSLLQADCRLLVAQTGQYGRLVCKLQGPAEALKALDSGLTAGMGSLHVGVPGETVSMVQLAFRVGGPHGKQTSALMSVQMHDISLDPILGPAKLLQVLRMMHESIGADFAWVGFHDGAAGTIGRRIGPDGQSLDDLPAPTLECNGTGGFVALALRPDALLARPKGTSYILQLPQPAAPAEVHAGSAGTSSAQAAALPILVSFLRATAAQPSPPPTVDGPRPAKRAAPSAGASPAWASRATPPLAVASPATASPAPAQASAAAAAPTAPAGAQQPPAGAQQPLAGAKQPPAGRKQPPAGSTPVRQDSGRWPKAMPLGAPADPAPAAALTVGPGTAREVAGAAQPGLASPDDMQCEAPAPAPSEGVGGGCTPVVAVTLGAVQPVVAPPAGCEMPDQSVLPPQGMDEDLPPPHVC